VSRKITFAKAGGERRYNTRSGRAPLPATRNTQIPPVRGPRTTRFARQTKISAQKGKKTMTMQAALQDETNFYRSRIEHMYAYTQKHKRECMLLFQWTFLTRHYAYLAVDTCSGIRLDDLRKRNVIGDEAEAERKYHCMLASGMKPDKTSGLWVDDSPKSEWLVIYAGQRKGSDGRVHRDGFTVRVRV
jgi:hypothetical protein